MCLCWFLTMEFVKCRCFTFSRSMFIVYSTWLVFRHFLDTIKIIQNTKQNKTWQWVIIDKPNIDDKTMIIIFFFYCLPDRLPVYLDPSPLTATKRASDRIILLLYSRYYIMYILCIGTTDSRVKMTCQEYLMIIYCCRSAVTVNVCVCVCNWHIIL